MLWVTEMLSHSKTAPGPFHFVQPPKTGLPDAQGYIGGTQNCRLISDKNGPESGIFRSSPNGVPLFPREGLFIATAFQIQAFTTHNTLSGEVRALRGGGAELGGRWCDVALPVLAGEHRAATLTPAGCCRDKPR
jgi:hypothetical protein